MGVSLDDWKEMALVDNESWIETLSDDRDSMYDIGKEFMKELCRKENCKWIKFFYYNDSYMYCLLYPDGKMIPIIIQHADEGYLCRSTFFEQLKEYPAYIEMIKEGEEQLEEEKQAEIKELEEKLMKLKAK